jgi:hypothetical protein
MKKTSEKLTTPFIKKDKKNKLPLSKARFSSCKEDFVITEQEEREGGFWGNAVLQAVSAGKSS